MTTEPDLTKSTSVECLLIGGPADGRRTMIGAIWSNLENAHVPRSIIAVDVSPRINFLNMQYQAPSEVSFENCEYVRQQFREGDARFWVYKPTGSQDSPMAQLIAGYKRGSV